MVRLQEAEWPTVMAALSPAQISGIWMSEMPLTFTEITLKVSTTEHPPAGVAVTR